MSLTPLMFICLLAGTTFGFPQLSEWVLPFKIWNELICCYENRLIYSFFTELLTAAQVKLVSDVYLFLKFLWVIHVVCFKCSIYISLMLSLISRCLKFYIIIKRRTFVIDVEVRAACGASLSSYSKGFKDAWLSKHNSLRATKGQSQLVCNSTKLSIFN